MWHTHVHTSMDKCTYCVYTVFENPPFRQNLSTIKKETEIAKLQ